MNKHGLIEILKNFPDDFNFKAVYEEPKMQSMEQNDMQAKDQMIILKAGKHKIKIINGKYCPKNNDELKILCDIESIWLGDIDTSKVIDMSGIFEFSNRNDFGGLEYWEVAQVKTMRNMFLGSCADESCSWNIAGWNVSNVEDMSGMFEACHFNGDISRWNVSSVKNMADMFRNTICFNQDISNWDISMVEDMSGIFAYTLAFNKDLSKWHINDRANINSMFLCAEALNILPKWDIKLFVQARDVFAGTIFNTFIKRKIKVFCKQAERFYPLTHNHLYNLTERKEVNLGKIDVSKITDMSCLFCGIFSSRKDFKGIETWNVSNVEDMSGMFCGNLKFNRNLGRWNIQRKTNVRGMFAHTNYPKELIESWREKVGEKMFEQAFNSESTQKQSAKR